MAQLVRAHALNNKIASLTPVQGGIVGCAHHVLAGRKEKRKEGSEGNEKEQKI